jgi:hypothetical protein
MKQPHPSSTAVAGDDRTCLSRRDVEPSEVVEGQRSNIEVPDKLTGRRGKRVPPAHGSAPPGRATRQNDTCLEIGKAASREDSGLDVRFQVVARAPGSEGPIDFLQDVESSRSGTPTIVGTIHLQLGTNATDTSLEQPLPEHSFERMQIT